MSQIYLLHENDAWMPPFHAALRAEGLPFADWHLAEGRLDLAAAPPEGVFYNRMSASSHTRGHRYAPEYASCVLAWLEGHGRRVANGTRALALEVNKVAQYAALERFGIRVPRTQAAVGGEAAIEAAGGFAGRPFITKHNRAGKGLGVKLFRNLESFLAHLDGPEFEPSVDGVLLIQEYIEAPEPFITRVEFVGGKLFYAVRVDTSQGFELCPADACRVDEAFCPADGKQPAMFEIVESFRHPLVERWEAFLAANRIEVAGIEFILDRDGVAYTYDVNTNTNYNPEAEAKAGRSAPRAVAKFLGRELAALEGATNLPRRAVG
ncbi:MAG: ATP-grasp domain-containing protein [Kiloniellales bacterium]